MLGIDKQFFGGQKLGIWGDDDDNDDNCNDDDDDDELCRMLLATMIPMHSLATGFSKAPSP